MRTDHAAVIPSSWRGMLGFVRRAWPAVIISAALVAPFALNNYWLRILTTALMFGALGQALNVLVGLSGYPSLGNVVFFGTGAYAAGVLANSFGMAPLPSVLAGAGVAAGYALLVSRAMLLLRGSYFLMATVALNALTLEIITVLRGLTKGALGLNIPPLVVGSATRVYTVFYFIFLSVAVASGMILTLLRRSKMGYGLLAIRGNEDVAQVLGIPAFWYKTAAWCISAALTGAIGGFYAYWIGFIDPSTVFDLIFSVEIFLIVLLGGRLLIWGPVLGALVFQYLSVITWARFIETHLAVLGAAIVLLVLFAPGGIPQVAERVQVLLRSGRATRAA